jgi:hypothetical protein
MHSKYYSVDWDYATGYYARHGVYGNDVMNRQEICHHEVSHGMQVVGFENVRHDILQGEVRMDYKATVRESGRPIVQSFLEWPSAAHRRRVNSHTPSYPHNGLSREKRWRWKGTVEILFLAYNS